MHLADFIEKECPGIGQIELAQLLTDGAGKGPGLVAEQLAFQQFVRNGGAIHFDEWLLAAAGMAVDHARDYFLAGSAFAANQHRSRGVGNLLDGVLHLFHLWTGTEKAGEIAVAADLIAQLRHFGGGALLVENFVNAKVKILQLKRLAQVIVGAQLGGAEDDFGTVLGRQQDDRDFGLDLLEPLQGIESIRSRQSRGPKEPGPDHRPGTCGELPLRWRHCSRQIPGAPGEPWWSCPCGHHRPRPIPGALDLGPFHPCQC